VNLIFHSLSKKKYNTAPKGYAPEEPKTQGWREGGGFTSQCAGFPWWQITCYLPCMVAQHVSGKVHGYFV